MIQVPGIFFSMVGLEALELGCDAAGENPKKWEMSSYLPCLSAAISALAIQKLTPATIFLNLGLSTVTPVGLTISASFIVLPLLCKSIAALTNPDEMAHKAAMVAGHLVRVAARVFSISMLIGIAFTVPLSLPAGLIAVALGGYQTVRCGYDWYATIDTGILRENHWQHRIALFSGSVAFYSVPAA